MVWTTRPARFNLRLVRAIRKALAKGERPVLPTVTRLLPVAPSEGGPAVICTVCLVCDDEGTYMATCLEVPSVLVFGDSEEQALTAAQGAIAEHLPPETISRMKTAGEEQSAA